MRSVYIPIANREYSKEETQNIIEELKRAGANKVMLVYSRILCNREKQIEEQKRFIKTKKALNEAGLNVGAWVAPTIGYGAEYFYDNNAPFTKLHTIKGNGDTIPGSYCGLDKGFSDELCLVFKDVAETGVSLILLEDDFTMTGGKAGITRMSCCCDKHLKLYRERLGENVTPEMLPELLVSSNDKKYRKTWLDLQGGTLKTLAEEIRKAVDTVDENIRIGLSANGSSYTIEGVPVFELAKIIAGKNKPFIRTTGAPYWHNTNTFAANIEASRIQNYWCGKDIDLFCEGDTYPRPRHFVSSALLEGFDQVLSAEGKTTGILKYMFDYNSKTSYETGYIDRHIKNADIYKEIDKSFSGGEAVGVNIFESVESFSDTDFGTDCTLEEYGNCGRGYIPFTSQQFLCDNSVPVTYGNKLCATLVFGTNALYIDEEQMKNGLIIDAVAAKILIERGFDIGIESLEPINKPSAEYYINENDMSFVSFERKGSFYRYNLKPEAKVLSKFYNSPGGLGIIPTEELDESLFFPACYLYENKKGQRFMVYSFAAETVTIHGIWSVGCFRNYYRQKQLAFGIEWLQKHPLPAMCFNNPELYILCKKNGDRMTVGLWNFFSDEVLKPTVKLDGNYRLCSCYNNSGEIKGDTLYLDDPIMPFGYTFFTVTEK